mmetsp:Transcript_118630/g.215747  ORF Transcript_118630/g.215747 Transcript_118630/m.215747 type:complete len:398 (+) Transcript_118630:34-1227(+)
MPSKVAVSEALGLLGLSPCSDDNVVVSTWRHLCKECHPDKRPDDPDAKARFQALTAAKDIILLALAQQGRAPKHRDVAASTRSKKYAEASAPRTGSGKAATHRVEVVSPWGSPLAQLSLKQHARIHDAKRELAAILSIPIARQQLLCKLTQRKFSNDEAVASLPQPRLWMLLTISYNANMSQKLLEAARTGDAQAATEALSTCADPWFCGPEGLTPILMAAQQGHVEVARALCTASVDVEATATDDVSPLMAACENGAADMVHFLCSQRADPEQVAAQSPFHTPLTLVASKGYLDVTRILVQAQANIDRVGEYDGTPLYHAARNGHLAIVRFLCLAGADKDQSAAAGETPLFVAESQNLPEIVSFLWEARADASETAQQDTPMAIANALGHAEVEKP